VLVLSIYQSFISGLLATTPLEAIGVIAGIVSVYFSKKEHVWVFPTGLVNTIIYIYISIKGSLWGEASVNVYYTIMSVYGWYLWTRKTTEHHQLINITYSSRNEWVQQLIFFSSIYIIIFFLLTYVQQSFAEGAIPWADALGSASAYTGMWLMAKKKIESWFWWILTNLVSIPLYFTKGYVFTSVQFLCLLILAIAGLMEWRKKIKLIN